MGYATVRKSYYDAPEGEVHYRYLFASAKDPAKAPILFLHMTAVSGRYYEKLMQRCAEAGHDCYAPDMPGFGSSYDPVDQPAAITYYVDAFMLLTKHANITKFHVMGHHTGASIGAEMAVLYPDRVLSLTVSGPAMLTEEEQIGSREEELVCFNYPVADGSHVKKTWDFCWGLCGGEPADMHPHILDVMRAYQGRIQAYSCVFHHDLIKTMGEVKCPVLNLTADEDMLSPFSGRVKEKLPNAVVEKIGGGNWEPYHDVDNFAKSMLRFIANL
ncbi:hypothetical protein BP5796_12358 [Coleophoma crateriformis]|uniref:AB hydrolase-1 domain-containing protein n=1 Tax=Coleophoma crateriformis TaxID=565419 RepID=A0A3D8Q9Y7_9HELO|nr:hypothetical protein BP5796_12358 [Coleophoma crateriformis]